MKMNTVEIYVDKVVTKPFKRKDGLFQTDIITNCHGSKKAETIVRRSEEDISKFVVGYYWLG